MGNPCPKLAPLLHFVHTSKQKKNTIYRVLFLKTKHYHKNYEPQKLAGLSLVELVWSVKIRHNMYNEKQCASCEYTACMVHLLLKQMHPFEVKACLACSLRNGKRKSKQRKLK